MGNRLWNIKKALNMLQNVKGIKIKKISSIYETDPESYKNQSKFLNCAVKIATSIMPDKLLSILQNIENKLKRKRIIKYGPRTIDLDILIYDNLIKSTKNLTIPHSLMHKRSFVLVPLFEISPDLVHPVFKEKIYNLLLKLWKI